MAEYKRVPCTECGIILPKNELTRLTEELEIERTSARFADGTPNNRTKTKAIHLLLCAACLQQRKDEEEALNQERLRRLHAQLVSSRRRSRIIAGMVVFGLLIALLTILRSSNHPSPTVSSPMSEAIASSSGASAISSGPSLNTTASILASDTSSDPTTVTAASSTSDPTSSKPAPDSEDISPTTTPQLRLAILRSLDTGQATSWQTSDAAFAGVAIAGAPQASTEQLCRTYRYTVNGQTSQDKIACRRPGFPWNLDNQPETPPY